MTKYALTITPVMLSLEELIPSSSRKMKSKGFSMLFRTIFVLSTLVVALTVPFFGNFLYPSLPKQTLTYFSRNAFLRNNNMRPISLIAATVAALIGSFIAMLIVSLQ